MLASARRIMGNSPIFTEPGRVLVRTVSCRLRAILAPWAQVTAALGLITTWVIPRDGRPQNPCGLRRQEDMGWSSGAKGLPIGPCA